MTTFPDSRSGVMQVLDSLHMGGAERVGVNLANLLPVDRYRSHLCVTAVDGPLSALVQNHVGLLRLERRGRFDVDAIWRLASYVKANRIGILHAHTTSLFISRAAALLHASGARVIWHDHYGRCELDDRPAWLYRIATTGVAGVIAVNEVLAEWARTRLRVPSDRVWYLPNFVDSQDDAGRVAELPGVNGKRIVCVANLRPQKDHLTLLRAMDAVRRKIPDSHLLLVGDTSDASYRDFIDEQISSLGLRANVTCLGPRPDVPAILRACDAGVLSSVSEGLPLALLEYGAAGLAVASTDVGQCADVMDRGAAGILVPPSSPGRLAAALCDLLDNPGLRRSLGRNLQSRVNVSYSATSVLSQLAQIYDQVAQTSPPAASCNSCAPALR